MKVLVIAQNTYREASRQPIYYMLLMLFGVLILLSPELTMFTLRDPSGVIREMGVASVTICCLLIALFSSSNCVWQEIERKTALTVLSKPVRREEFLLGKFLGVFWGVFLAALFLTTLLTLTVWWNEGIGEVPAPDPGSSWEYLWGTYFPLAGAILREKLSVILGGVVLSLVQLAIVTALSVSVSVVFPMVVNICFCVGIFLLGNLSNSVQELTQTAPGWIRYPTELLRIVIPNFESLNGSLSVATGEAVSGSYMLGAVGYGVVYTAAALLIGLTIFQERELM